MYKTKIKYKNWYKKTSKRRKELARKYYQKNRRNILKYEHSKYQKNHKRIAIYNNKYYLKNRKKMIKNQEKYYKNNQDEVLSYHRKYSLKLKLKVISFYSKGTMKCNICKEKRLPVLQIDHINGNGAKERKHLKLNSGSSFYRWLINKKFPYGYQVLCANCNWMKRYENKEM